MKVMANLFKSNLLVFCLIIITVCLIDFCDNNCKKIRLIQPLEPSAGLSYVVFGGGNYYMITNSQLNDPNIPLQPINITDDTSKGFRDPTGILVYYNKDCSPPKNFLFVSKYIYDQENNLYPWYTTLNLTNWSTSETWSKPDTFLPPFMAKDPYMGNVAIQLDFTMLWSKTNRLYMIQFPIPGAAQSRWGDYHIIKISKNCSADEYQVDLKAKKIVEILNPYDSYDCCFIHDDQQIICYGNNGFTVYDIDLNTTNDNNLRVKNINKQFQRIPIMDIIENIAKHNDCNTQTTTASTYATTVSTTTSTDILTVPLILSTSTIITSSDETPEIETVTETEEPDENELAYSYWLIFIFLILSMIILILSLYFCCKKRDKELESPFGSPLSPVTQSPISPRSVSGLSLMSQKSFSFSPSGRSVVTSAIKEESSAISLGIQRSKHTQSSLRDGKDVNSNLDSQRSKDDSGANKNLPNASSISSLSNMRSQNEQKVEPPLKVTEENLDTERSKYSLIGEKAVPNESSIGSLASIRSKDIINKTDSKKLSSNTSNLETHTSMRSKNPD